MAGCADSKTSLGLHYVEVDVPGRVCRCFESESPASPDNAAVSAFTGRAVKATDGDVSVYAVGPPARQHIVVPEESGTAYFAPAFEEGVVAGTYLGNTSASDVKDCAKSCVTSFGKTQTNAFYFDSALLRCTCIGYDILRESVRLETTMDPQKRLYMFWWCEGVRPDGNEGAFVHNSRTGEWCQGRVGGHMGEALLSGELLNGRLPAEQCVQACNLSSVECTMAEVQATAWSDMFGDTETSPAPPPLPPTPPTPPSPSYPPLPPNYPLTEGGGGQQFRSWHPTGSQSPTESAEGTYSITCQAPSSCSGPALPVFQGGRLETTHSCAGTGA